MPGAQLFFGNVVRVATEEEVAAIFSAYGKVEEVTLFRAYKASLSQGQDAQIWGARRLRSPNDSSPSSPCSRTHGSSPLALLHAQRQKVSGRATTVHPSDRSLMRFD